MWQVWLIWIWIDGNGVFEIMVRYVSMSMPFSTNHWTWISIIEVCFKPGTFSCLEITVIYCSFFLGG